MKKLLLLGIGFFLTQALYSQKAPTIVYYNWSNPTTFELSPSPIIKGYGYYSDSLSTVYNGKRFYEYNREYYCIQSWADYYYWFTKEYWYRFKNPDLYEYYYMTKDDYGMASYIASSNYLGRYYPSLITLNFGDMNVKENRLMTDQYLARNDRRIKNLNRQIHGKKTIYDNSYPITDLKNQANKERVTSISNKRNRESINKTGVNKEGSRKSSNPRADDKSLRPVQPKTSDIHRRPAQTKSSNASKKKVIVKKKDSL